MAMPPKKKNTTEPDFNFPKDVLEQAQQQMDASESSPGSGQTFLNGLLRGLRAYIEIEPDNIDGQIAYLDSHLAKAKLTKTEGALAMTIRAQVMNRYYTQHIWKIRNRHVPGDSVALWSHEQFTDSIAALYSRASALAASVEAKDFIPEVLTAGDTQIFGDLGSVFHAWSGSKAPFSSHCKKGSPAYFYWLAQESDPDVSIDKYEKLIEDNWEYDWCNLLLVKLIDYECPSGVVEDQKARQKRERIVALTEKAIAAHPKFPYNLYLRQEINRVTAPAIDMRLDSYVPVNEPIMLIVKTYNAKSVTLDLCKVESTDLKRAQIASAASIKRYSYKPESINDIHPLDISFPSPGTYMVRVKLDDSQTYNPIFTQATPFIPFLLSQDSEGVVITTDYTTGAPFGGVEVIGQGTKAQFLGKTSNNGLLRVAPWDTKDKWSYGVKFAYKGCSLDFDNSLRFNFSEKEKNQVQYRLNVLSDRALYHPGETVEWVIVGGRKDVNGQKMPLAKTNVIVSLLDVNRKNIEKVTVTTDAMGRASGSFTIPSEGLTGAYTIRAVYSIVSGSCPVMVSDFKAPVFEVKIDSLDQNYDRVILKGVAKTLSGMPVADARVSLNVRRAYSWGDLTIDYSTQTLTEGDGRFSFEVNSDSVPNDDLVYIADISVTSAASEVAKASRIFKFDCPYTLSFDKAEGNYSTEEPFTFTVKATDMNGSTAELGYKWTLSKENDTKQVIASGHAKTGSSVSIDVSDVAAGEYEICVNPDDDDLADMEYSDVYTFYNIKKNEVPDGSVIFLPNNNLKAPSDAESVELVVGTPKNDVYLFVAVSNDKGITDILNFRLPHGFSSLNLPLVGNENHQILLCVQRNGTTQFNDLTVSRYEAKKISIVVESMRDNLVPGTAETWRLRITGADAAGAAAVATMYNKALDQLIPYRGNLGFYFSSPYRYFSSSTVRHYGSRMNYSIKYKDDIKRPEFEIPGLQYMNWSGSIYVRGAKQANYTSSASLSHIVVSEQVVDSEEEELMAPEILPAYGEQRVANAVATEADGAAGAAEEPVQEYRQAEVLQGFWRPRLVADREGVVTIEFTVPDANITWAFHMSGWTAELLTADFDATALASKPVMVQGAVPRYLRAGDSATLRATVFNNTDSTATVATEFEIFNPADGRVIDTVRSVLTLEAKASAIVTAPVTGDPTLTSVGYRVKATAGNYSDGETGVLPILASSQMLVESQEFYLDAKGSSVTLKVPSAKDAVSTLQYCQNPIWTVVKALRGVQWEDYSLSTSAATQLASSALARHIVSTNPRIASVLAQWKANPDSEALTGMLARNDDLKMLLQNQTPWVRAAQSETDRMNALTETLDSTRCSYLMDKSLEALKKFQNADGGFRWAVWSDTESSHWVTVNVLQTLGIANSFGALPREFTPMARDAFRYLEQQAVKDPKDMWLRMQYALMATWFPELNPGADGNKIIREAADRLTRTWRTMGLSDKAYTAMVLNRAGRKADAAEIIRSIGQYGVSTPGRGLEFPSVKDMRTYGNLIQAVATVTPGNPILDPMRQWVILQAQATDDLGACNPDYIIASVMFTGSPWADMTSVQPIAIDGRPATFPQAELGTGYLTAPLAPGSTVEVSPTGVTPSYGSIVTLMTAPMTEVSAFRSADLEISKRMMVQREGKWVESTDFRFGEEVQVQLQIRAKRTLEYVAVTDERPAGFEPREQLPGWLWSDGIGFYRENRDASTRLFIGYMPKGSYSLTYSMTAATEGTFASGVATLQSQYDPALTAHSSGTLITITR